jgi:hypothetical protein
LKERYKSLRPKKIKTVGQIVKQVIVKEIWREGGLERAKLTIYMCRKRMSLLIEGTLLAPWGTAMVLTKTPT